jgi:hypothetical protein
VSLTEIYTRERNLRASKCARKSAKARMKRPFTRTLDDLHTRKKILDIINEPTVTWPILGFTA